MFCCASCDSHPGWICSPSLHSCQNQKQTEYIASVARSFEHSQIFSYLSVNPHAQDFVHVSVAWSCTSSGRKQCSCRPPPRSEDFCVVDVSKALNVSASAAPPATLLLLLRPWGARICALFTSRLALTFTCDLRSRSSDRRSCPTRGGGGGN